ncbi:putative disease resistance protein RGA3 [Silene latifolia]|uniref:putative disease resistance protein RGA3 n=1 Tax=Silene latifolia TaxID=37657 RepID=UPI003D7875B5
MVENEHKFVGRDDEVSDTIHRLLDSTENVGFLTIVGIGGLGKTTLAKHVFNDTRIVSEYPVRFWVCVADQGGAPLDVKGILLKILESVECKIDEKSTIEHLTSEYRRNLAGKKCLLVLDDIWTENASEWNKLKELLMISGSGSRIIATTRSKETARIIGIGTHTDMVELEGLSKENSWRLFEMVAFKEGSSRPSNFVAIGERIVEKCNNVPLAIKVLGTLLYDQPINKWQSFETNGFAGICRSDNEVMSILKFSYDNLEPSVKSCFAYCALFPKDFVIKKEMILNLWEAQGFIVPFHEGQSIENAAEEHFSILAKRCFFKDVMKNEYGEVESFKIHDLMYDLAQKVSGNEMCIVNSNTHKLENGVRHVFLATNNIQDTHIPESKIRSFLWFENTGTGSDNEMVNHVENLAKSWECLRALALKRLPILPDTIGNLLHLRYLNLANTSIQNLPNSIVRLYNLQTLNLNSCEKLKEWPKNFSKLVNLRHLYIDNCHELKCMPLDMSKMSNLRGLTRFVVKDESKKGMQRVGQLKDLKALAMNLAGRISIIFRLNFKSAEVYDWEGSCMEDAEHLNDMKLHFGGRIHLSLSLFFRQLEEMGATEESVIEKLKPHPNLRKFELQWYKGEKIGSWGTLKDNWATCLPNLVRIVLRRCDRLQQLPLLSKLLHLKHLHFYELPELKYMEVEVKSKDGLESSGSIDSEIKFFPSLESLELDTLRNLKGWWRHDSGKMHCQPAFPRLSQLTIKHCNELISFPPCPSLQELHLKGVAKALRDSFPPCPSLKELENYLNNL